jgi:hypothetical protein
VVTDCTTPEPFCFLGVIWSMGCFIKIHTRTHTHTHTQYGHLNMPFSENFDAFLQTLSPRSCAICSLFAHSSWASNTSYWTCFGFNNPFYEVRRERWLTKKEVTSTELSQDKESILLILESLYICLLNSILYNILDFLHIVIFYKL